MAAYIVVDICVLDPAGYEEYKKLAPSSIRQYGGKYLIRGGTVQTLEGEWPLKRLVVLEFESAERARAGTKQKGRGPSGPRPARSSLRRQSLPDPLPWPFPFWPLALESGPCPRPVFSTPRSLPPRSLPRSSPRAGPAAQLCRPLLFLHRSPM